ncbi:PucR family transcriptional regulator [Aquipuribacter nitratireducens]|uniref:PucR family transcriptional regulator n=1 Tax=Aquipuribacter nitratireducens TaxID=650104 RepID=A0ABW0GJ49_9MICO
MTLDEAPVLLGEGSLRALEWASSTISGKALARMDAELPWFPSLPPEARASVGMVAQSGVAGFVRWCRAGAPVGPSLRGIDLFGAAPRELTRLISLHQTVTLVRLAIDTSERLLEDTLEDPEELTRARVLLLRYAREVAFAAAEVYARAAETRGAWDARLEALVVDALVRGEADESLASQASALSWPVEAPTTVAVAPGDPGPAAHVLRRVARAHDTELLVGHQADRLVLVLGGAADPMTVVTAMLEHIGDGPVVVGPTRAGLPTAPRSARAALAGATAARAWVGVPRPVLASALLPERVLAGDVAARRALVDLVHAPLVAAGNDLLATVQAYVDSGGAMEATARALFVHANTVRYRLTRVEQLTGLLATDPRERWTLQMGLALGRLAGPPRTSRL